MTWIVTDLNIQGVKGVLDRSGDFKLASKRNPRSIVIFAPNACGKSGYADAVEYLFSEDGCVKHLGKGGLDSEKGGKHAIPHVLAEERGIVPEISITVFETNTEERLTITRPVVTGRSDSRPPELERIIQGAPAHRILRQHDLRQFVVDDTPGEKYSELSRWIGLAKLEDVLKHLVTTTNELEKVDLNREIAERKQDILTNTDQEITSDREEDILKWCSDQSEKYLGRKMQITSKDELLVAINELNQAKENSILGSSAAESYQAKVLLAKELPELVSDNGQLDICKTALTKAVEREQKLNEIRSRVKSSVFKKTWEAAKDLLSAEAVTSCPVCQTEWEKTAAGSQEEAVIQITTRLKELTELINAEKDYEKSIDDQKSAIEGLDSEWDEIKSSIQTLGATKYDSALEGISSDIVGLIGNQQPIVEIDQPASELLNSVRTLISEELIPWVQSIEIKGIPAEADAIEKLVAKLKNLRAAMARLGELERERQEYRRIEQSFSAITNTIRERSADLVNKIVDAFRADVISIYQMIHPSGAVPNIYIVPDVDSRTLSLRIDFHHEGRTVPPAGYLSESYINTLGVALFISSVGLFNREFPFIFLDDIVSSYDANHRARIVDVIAERLDDFQVFLTTHDFRFYTMLRDRLSGKGWYFERVASWDLEHGPIRESDGLRKDEIEQLIRKGNPTISGNTVRQYMEDWLDKMCVKYWAFTLHKRGNKEYDRTLFDFWGPFIDRLRSIKGNFFQKQIESEPCYDRLRAHSLLNYYSHAQANPYEWPSIGDVEYIWTEFQAFQNLFNCASCGNLLRYDHDANRLYCTCGGQIFASLS
jgi:hypothetical protein